MQRNFTLTLDDDLLRKVRVLAERRNRSVSALLREELSRLVAEDEAYEAAKRAALQRLARGAHLGGGPLLSRDELHDRVDRSELPVARKATGRTIPALTNAEIHRILEKE